MGGQPCVAMETPKTETQASSTRLRARPRARHEWTPPVSSGPRQARLHSKPQNLMWKKSPYRHDQGKERDDSTPDHLGGRMPSVPARSDADTHRERRPCDHGGRGRSDRTAPASSGHKTRPRGPGNTLDRGCGTGRQESEDEEHRRRPLALTSWAPRRPRPGVFSAESEEPQPRVGPHERAGRQPPHPAQGCRDPQTPR